MDMSDWSLICIKGIVIYLLPVASRMALDLTTQCHVQNILGSLFVVVIGPESKADSLPSRAQIYIFSCCGTQEGNVTLLSILSREIIIMSHCDHLITEPYASDSSSQAAE
jgi:hypothetical protein